MKNKKVSPKINSIEWGKLTTDEGQSYKDAKLYPGGSRKWDWNETGTHHIPGIQPQDIHELLENGADTIILSQGFNEKLQVSDETVEYLAQRDVEYYVLQSEKAVKEYNRLRKDHRVGALIHSTC